MGSSSSQPVSTPPPPPPPQKPVVVTPPPQIVKGPKVHKYKRLIVVGASNSGKSHIINRLFCMIQKFKEREIND